MEVSTLLSEVLALDIEKRIEFVNAILDSIAGDSVPWELTDDRKRTFDRRIADLDANPNDVLTWEEIKARVRGEK
jgi:putative addiction module component (TIGR02574 family)